MWNFQRRTPSGAGWRRCGYLSMAAGYESIYIYIFAGCTLYLFRVLYSFVGLFWWVIPIVRFFCLSNVEPCPLGSQMQTGGCQCDLGHWKVMGKLVIYTQKLISAQTLMKFVVDGVQRLNLSKSQVWIIISYPRDFCWYGPTMPNSHVFQLWHVLLFFDEGQRSSCACRGSSRPGFAASECFKCPGSPCKCPYKTD